MTSTAKSLRQRVSRVLNSQKTKTVTVLSCLLAVEDEFGYLPQEAVKEVARFTDSTINDVWGVASFYTNFQFEPPGRHRVEVCWGPTCYILGAMGAIGEVLKGLDLSGEGKVEDGAISVRYSTCLGACANGPVVSVDHHLIGRITPERAGQIVSELKEQRSVES